MNDGAKDKTVQEETRRLAEDFVRNSPTFAFDAIEDSLYLVETLYSDTVEIRTFVFHFVCRQVGYGDRTGQMPAQILTPHEAVVTVDHGNIKSALMDGKWDMANQHLLVER